MLIFVTAISVALIVSFLCSIFESVLLSLTRPQIGIMMSNRNPREACSRVSRKTWMYPLRRSLS